MKGDNFYTRKMGHPKADCRPLFKLLTAADDPFPRASQQDLRPDLFTDVRHPLIDAFPMVLREKQKGQVNCFPSEVRSHLTADILDGLITLCLCGDCRFK